MKHKLSFLIVLSFIFAFNAQAQLTIYKTYDDYKNNIGEKHDNSYEFVRFGGGTGSPGYLLFFKNKNGDKIKIICGEIWGFTFKNDLYRIGVDRVPAVLVSNNKICFYKDGYAHLLALSERPIQILGSEYYLSKDLKTDIISLPLYKTKANNKLAVAIKKFTSQYPDTRELLNCFGGADNWDDMLDCFNKFDKPSIR